jgi:hypothetical protein
MTQRKDFAPLRLCGGKNKTMKSLKKDNFLFGLFLGIISPVFMFGVIWLMNWFLMLIGVAKLWLDTETQVLVSIFVNLVYFRYFFVTLKYEKSGNGVLGITFASVILFFLFKNYIF